MRRTFETVLQICECILFGLMMAVCIVVLGPYEWVKEKWDRRIDRENIAED